MKNPERVAELLAELRALADNDFERHRIDVLARDLTAPPTVEVIDEKRQSFNGIMFYKCGKRHFNANLPIHREVWRYHHGDIPDGCEIHHIDEDKANNLIENLQCLTRNEHRQVHGSIMQNIKKKTFVCEYCGKEYVAYDTGRNRFCSSRCLSRAFRKSHKTEKKICSSCGKEFIATHKNQKYCSPQCATFAQKKREVRTCPVCGKEFEAVVKTKTKCCSRACSYKLRSVGKKITRTCPVCGKEFETYVSRPYTACSQACGQKPAVQNHLAKKLSDKPQ